MFNLNDSIMKHFIYNLIVVFYLTVFYSCNNDLFFEYDHPQISRHLSLEEKDSIQTRSSCSRCLPMITTTHDPFNQFVITWTGYEKDPLSHPVTISYKINNSSYSKRIGYRNGEIRENIYSNSYLVTWSISCSAFGCASCKNSGSFSKLSTGETEEGVYSDCHKKYLNYKLVKVDNERNAYDLVFEDYQGNRFNTEKYMTIDMVKTYVLDTHFYGSEEEFLGGAYLRLIGPDQLRLFLEDKDPNKNYKIKLMSSKCANNQEHYFEAGYRLYGYGSSMNQLTLINKHRNI